MANFTDKIRAFNQYVLAICGLIGIFILIAILIFLIDDVFGSWNTNIPNQNDGILAIEEVEELNKDSIRKQIISFNSMTVIDSANQIFMLPVGQANLENGEKYDNEFSKDFSYAKSRRYGPARNFNNLILYYDQSSQSEIIFDNRTSISDFFIREIKGHKYIVIEAAIEDTNKDRLLNEKDVQHLFIYDLKNKTLHKIKKEDSYTTLDVLSIPKSDIIIVQFGVDRNHDGFFDVITEPKLFYKLDVNTMAVHKIVGNGNLNSLQKQLEGR